MSQHHGPFPVTRALIEAQTAAAAPAVSGGDLPLPAPVGEWGEDILGPGHEAQTLPLERDDEGDVVATLVRYRPERDTSAKAPSLVPEPRYAVLYLHGWSDYVLNPEMGPFWAGIGGAFYGLDLRKYGRSLRVGQTPGYITDLTTYDEDLEAALAVIAREHPGLPVVLKAHSTGGLTAALFADRHRGRFAGLVLVAPWLEVQGSTLARIFSMSIIAEIARPFPRRRIAVNPDLGYYAATIDSRYGGEWDVVSAWRPRHGFSATHGWAAAILRGHTHIEAGLDVSCPVLVLRSHRTLISAHWDERMRESDIVLDVDVIAQRALRIGREVTVATIEGALHDVLLSRKPVRADAYRRIERWAKGYLP